MLVCMERLGDITNRLVAKLMADRANKENPAAASPKASSGGSDLAGKRSIARDARAPGEDRGIVHARNEVGGGLGDMGKAAPIRTGKGEETLCGNQNVIDYRERPRLLAAWGSRRSPVKGGATPKHLRQRPAKRGHRERLPRGSR